MAGAMQYTGTSGAMVYQVTNGVNAYTSTNQYISVGLWNVTFSTAVINSLEKNRPVIALVKSSVLGPKYAPSQGHYVTIKGYAAGFSGSSSISDVYYNDPYNNSAYYGTWTTTFANMKDAIVAHSSYIVAA